MLQSFLTEEPSVFHKISSSFWSAGGKPEKLIHEKRYGSRTKNY